MKHIIVTFLILSSVANLYSQDCKYRMNEVDEFTNELMIVTNPERIGKLEGGTYLRLEMMRFKENKLFRIVNTGIIGCSSSDSSISIKLVDGDVIKLQNIGKTDCSDRPIFTFLINDFIKELSNVEIDKIRIVSTEGYIDSYNIKNPKYFIESIPCIN